MSGNHFVAYGFGTPPFTRHSILIKSEEPIANYFQPNTYKGTVEFALGELPKVFRERVLFMIPGGKK